ncbi:restriction endonuclease subunit S [Salmonella enterica subsp. enterica serovar Okatie]|nr:restriction endonuclease subunit S [Salmonella enterica]EBH9639679.1 restriction endonuclease subunit S [Salmonella enterica subsp. enterica serovar Okatie]EDT6045855.1 restriction endonuclease subunit S [Salmonella enterica subsp. enterica serovar Newyork]EAM2727930.1 restriction endonuclease subunit S [Salmonella enterica]EAM3012916.1 restriction endonuclease subunit S [Salmonella enterica]
MSSNYREQWTSVGGHFPSHWQFFKLEELLENTKGIAVGVMYPGDHTAEGIPLIKVGDVKDGYIASQPSFFISPEVDEEYKRTRLNGTELLITLVGNPGDCVVVEPYMAGWNAARALAVVRLKDTGLREWLKYILLSKPAKHLIDARLNTTVQKTLNLKDIRELGIPIPPKHERDMIIKNISAIEQKKIVNSDTNQTLEQMAQALFKSWFVDFEPVKAKIAVLEAGGSQEDATLAAMTAISGKDADALAVFEREHPEQYAELKATAELFPSAMQESELGEIPVGWLVKPLGDSLEIKRGGSPRPIKDFIRPTGYPWVKIADATASTSPFLFKTSEFIKEEGLKKTVYLRKGDLILSNSATPGLPKFLQLDACIHDGWLYFPKISNYTDTYLYFLFLKIRRELVAKGNGSVFTNLKTDILREHLAVLPEYKIVNRFSVLALSYLDAIKANELTINSLSCLRDTLLPKLLSGEISLPEAEQIISEEA